MKALTREELKSLVDCEHGVCLSLYLPTQKAGNETLGNPARLRALLREARERLDKPGADARAAVDTLLKPVEGLLDDTPFWRFLDRGLAIFAADGFFRAYKLPYEVPELAVVAAGFHLKPLLPLLAYNGEFLILALSKSAVKLYRASRYAIEEVPLNNVLQSAAEVFEYDETERTLQVRPGGPGSHVEQTAFVHGGHGAFKEEVKDRTLNFFHHLDRALHPYLKDERCPLVLASVEYYLPLYRDANSYPHLIDAVVPGNPENMSEDELRKAAWKKVEPLFLKAREEAASAIELGLTKGQATDDLEAAVAAACHGQAASCFVALDEHRWGAFDDRTAKIVPLEREDRLACDLLDLAAVQTLLHGGDVFPARQSADFPGHGPVAVLQRY